MKELTLVEKDRVGLLADVSEILGKAHVNIQSVFVDVTRAKQAIIHVILEPRATLTAAKALRKHGFKVMNSDILIVRTKDTPGELAKVCRLLADKGINVTNAFSISHYGGEALDAISTTDNTKARKIIKEYL